jgi:predicted O-linked N-acetylglucosamine transferase (SPINDLY family)/predicted SAM-dependent methyltransferase
MFLDELTAESTEESLEYYWQSALDGILSDDWEAAQAALLMPFFGCGSEQHEQWLQSNLIEFLHDRVPSLDSEEAIETARKIFSFAQSVFPHHFGNLLCLIEADLQSNQFNFLSLIEQDFLAYFAATPPEDIDGDRLHWVVSQLIHRFDGVQCGLLPDIFIPELVITFLDGAIDRHRAMTMLVSEAFLLGEQRQLKRMRAAILEICLERCQPKLPWYFDIMTQTASALSSAGQHDAAIALSETCCKASLERTPEDIVIASMQLLSALMEAGRWQLIPATAQRHQANIDRLIELGAEIRNCGPTIASSYFLNYVDDAPRILHKSRNAIGQLCAASIQKKYGVTVHQPKKAAKNKVLRIGYVASTFRKHSVGWLSRWLFSHHDHQKFQVFLYNVSHNGEDEFHKQFFSSKADASYFFGVDVSEIVRQIQQDEIDILVDMDSLALSSTYEVMCCRPAPIQLTWLGWDASGCPEIDYFMADPYVVPEDAQDYYHSKIWRLSQTYLAVDGFETAVPTQRRTDYKIPEDGIVYLCGQKSYKHNPEILRLQLQIIKEVPNSYLLVKLSGDRDSLINTYRQVAEEVGISMDRLRFLDRDPDEYTHRANLGIADVVLDTFPYNGATTTLETLWAGVPMVTKVGQAFVARNSYAFMMNVGLTEGIAHSDEEYVAWGVKLGTNPELRQQISGQLIQSRKTSPLWNAKQFTSEMENAYRQMWEIHQESLKAEGDKGGNNQASLPAPIRLHIGGQAAHPDWKIFDALSRPEVDFLGDAKDLSQFADGSIAAIYASHVLEHFYYLLDNELLLTLKEWHRVLEDGGELMISVPNLQVICGLYADSRTPPNARHHLMRMIFGGQIDQYDVHKVGFDPDTLGMYLQQAGFRDVQVVPAFGLFPDCSSLEFAGVPISLNMIAKK